MGKITELYKEYGCLMFIFGWIVMLSIVGLVYTFIGFVFMSLFNWIVPLFWSNAPILTLWQSVGTIMFVLIVASFIKGIFIDK